MLILTVCGQGQGRDGASQAEHAHTFRSKQASIWCFCDAVQYDGQLSPPASPSQLGQASNWPTDAEIHDGTARENTPDPPCRRQNAWSGIWGPEFRSAGTPHGAIESIPPATRLASACPQQCIAGRWLACTHHDMTCQAVIPYQATHHLALASRADCRASPALGWRWADTWAELDAACHRRLALCKPYWH